MYQEDRAFLIDGDAEVDLHFVYLAHDLTGKNGWIYDQATYSILSLMAIHDWHRAPEGISIVAYTDAPKRLELLEETLAIRPQGRGQIIAAMGVHRYMHRYKAIVLCQATSRAESPVVFVDSDIYFQEPILERVACIAPGRVLMYAREFAIREPGTRRQRRFTRLLKAIIAYDSRIPHDIEPHMYNSGIVGLHPFDFDLLRESLEIVDKALEIDHSHVCEQFALSIALARRKAQVLGLDDLAHHYWDQREEYAAAISPIIRTIRERRMSVPDAVQYVREHPLDVPPYRKPNVLTRAWRKLTGRGKMPSIRIQEEIRKLAASEEQ